MRTEGRETGEREETTEDTSDDATKVVVGVVREEEEEEDMMIQCFLSFFAFFLRQKFFCGSLRGGKWRERERE